MDDVLAGARSQLHAVFAGRPVIIAGGPAAGATPTLDRLRDLGARRFLVVSAGLGTGAVPEGEDVDIADLGVPTAPDVMSSFRLEERAIARPAAAVLECVERFDSGGDAVVLGPPFLDVRRFGERTIFGARRKEWVALEDKTRLDELCEPCGVRRADAVVVDADETAIGRAAARLDRGAGTVWSGDARDGFNGSGSYVRWVCDDASRREALELLVARCDRVRVATFVEGIPCSIHGFVVDDGVAVFRPVELLTLRAPAEPRLRYCGCATFYDPPAPDAAVMRAAARRIGEQLRATVGFRGAFTLDGISGRDGWVVNECNPRFGAGLGYADKALPELALLLLQYAVVERAADAPSAALERALVEAADTTRWGGAWTGVERLFDESTTTGLVVAGGGFRAALDGEVHDGALTVGPGRTGGFARVDFDPARTPAGPAVAGRAVAALAFADETFGLGLGALAPANAGS